MKRIGYVFENIITNENIERAILCASKGKKKNKIVQRVLNNKDYYIKKIKDLLINNKFKPGPYKEDKIIDGSSKKERLI